jgi:undecaprenyl pyrophosphate synthase
MFTNVVIRSTGNRKTGEMPTTARGMETCPKSCPFLPPAKGGQAEGGCYATGRISAQVANSVRAYSPSEAQAVIDRSARSARYLRDRVVGEPSSNGEEVDMEYLRSVAKLATDNNLVPFGYTHMWRRFAPQQQEELQRLNYVMNASVESIADAEEAVRRGWRVFLVNDDVPNNTKIAGRVFRQCPEQTHGLTCAQCGLCARQGRRVEIVERVHGTARQKARESIRALD